MPLPFTNFVKTTTIVGAPTDTTTGVAPGRDPLGVALTTADYDDLGHADGSFNITESTGTPFASVQVGDYIHLAGGTGITVGLYEIATVTSSNSINLTESAGSDSTGDVTSSIGPWATIQYGFDNTTTTGDQLIICNDGNGTGTDWEYTVTLDIDTNQGGNEGIYVRGASSRGLVDGTLTTISGASIAAATSLVTIGGGIDFWQFYDLRFTGATSHNMNCGTNAQNAHKFYRCRFDGAVGASSDGIAFEGSSFDFVDCEFDGNGRDGARCNTTNRGNSLVMRSCSSHDNTGNGVLCGAGDAGAMYSLFYDNGGDGWAINRQVAGMWWDSCVFFGNIGDGIGMFSSPYGDILKSISGCVFRSNTAYAISLGSALDTVPQIHYCCFSNNTSGVLDSSGAGVTAFLGQAWDGTTEGTTNIVSDPQFVSETDGSEDFTPAAGSPLIGAGLDAQGSGNKDIGAIQHVDAGGGGGSGTTTYW